MSMDRAERGADVVADALLDGESKCYAHALKLCEVFYAFHRASGIDDASQAISDLSVAGVIEDASLAPQGIILTADHHEFDVLAAQTPYHIKFIR
jgi:hypothetical protein